MLASIVIPTYNNETTIEWCLQSLVRQTLPDFEILVVNDGSTDRTAGMVAAQAAGDRRIHLASLPRRRGPAAARNVALGRAQGDFLVFIDGDMSAPPEWLETLLAPLQENRADCVGGPDYVPSDAPLISRCIGHSVDSPICSGGLRWGRTRLVTYLPGTGNLALRRSILEQTGGFNESFDDTGEDKEFLYRVRRAGWRIDYLATAPLWHHRAPDVLRHVRKMLAYGRRRVDIWKAMPDTLEWPHVAPAVLVLMLLATLPWLGTRVLAGVPWMATGAILLADAIWGAIRLREPRAVGLLAITSGAVPLGYGLGIVTGWLARRKGA